MKKVLLVITGSIAAYKTVDLCKDLQDSGYEVDIILTNSASKFVTPLILQSFCKGRVYQDALFDMSLNPMIHVELGKWADAVVIAPASADFIAKMACGFASSLSLSMLLANKGKVFIAPAMNPTMWEHPSIGANLAVLKSRGAVVIEPVEGSVACGDFGYGKYAGNEAVVEALKRETRGNGKLVGKRVVVTLGSTREMLDPVRFIGNISSGKMGILLVEELIRRGSEVTLIAGYVEHELPVGPKVKVKRAFNAKEMMEAAMEALPSEVFIACAAVGDFRPKEYSASKIKKGNGEYVVELEKNVDVVKEVGGLKDGRRPGYVVGFSLESDNHVENAGQKLEGNQLDLIVLNKVEHIHENRNHYVLISKRGQEDIGLVEKKELARVLVDKLELMV